MRETAFQALADGEVAALFGSEGGDFLGGSIERLHEAYAEGLRVLAAVAGQ